MDENVTARMVVTFKRRFYISLAKESDVGKAG